MDEIKEIREVWGRIYRGTSGRLIVERYEEERIDAALDRLEARKAELTKDRDYWRALAMQFHDAVHAEIERRAKVEI